MNEEKESILKKSRSGRACIREGYQFFTSHFKRIFRHTWVAALCFAVVSAAAASLPVFVAPNMLWPALLLEMVAVILLLVISYRRLVRKQLFERLPKGSIPRWAWLHHLGMETLVWLFCLLVVLSLSIITALPMLIVMAANWLNNVGILTGDPDGMPSYMTWLTIIVFLIAGFIQAYVWLTILGPVYLMRGSISQQEKERAEMKAKIEEESKPKKYEQNLIYRP
ncbi:MAG: hypothetical protein IJJ56_08415 [Prevotella sp.]|nr:hypothetical protein [Prevotella sp.]